MKIVTIFLIGGFISSLFYTVILYERSVDYKKAYSDGYQSRIDYENGK